MALRPGVSLGAGPTGSRPRVAESENAERQQCSRTRLRNHEQRVFADRKRLAGFEGPSDDEVRVAIERAGDAAGREGFFVENAFAGDIHTVVVDKVDFLVIGKDHNVLDKTQYLVVAGFATSMVCPRTD